MFRDIEISFEKILWNIGSDVACKTRRNMRDHSELSPNSNILLSLKPSPTSFCIFASVASVVSISNYDCCQMGNFMNYFPLFPDLFPGSSLLPPGVGTS